MIKVRVYELAKEFGLESKDVVRLLTDMGMYVKSASSSVEDSEVRAFKAWMRAGQLAAQVTLAEIGAERAEALRQAESERDLAVEAAQEASQRAAQAMAGERAARDEALAAEAALATARAELQAAQARAESADAQRDAEAAGGGDGTGWLAEVAESPTQPRDEIVARICLEAGPNLGHQVGVLYEYLEGAAGTDGTEKHIMDKRIAGVLGDTGCRPTDVVRVRLLRNRRRHRNPYEQQPTRAELLEARLRLLILYRNTSEDIIENVRGMLDGAQ